MSAFAAGLSGSGGMNFGGAMASAGGSMLGSAMNSFGQSAGSALGNLLFGGISARRQWKYTQKQMKLQQQYALEQMQKQSELSYANWQKQFDYENDYNTPTNVFDRYLKAGVTPAAVLGSSGVGVNATMSGGSAGMPSASGPSGGSPVAPGPSFAGDPTAIAQNMLASSQIDLNKSQADLNKARTDKENATNFGAEAFRRAFDLNNQLTEAGITDYNARARAANAVAEWQEARNVYKDLFATYDFQKTMAEYGEVVARYNRAEAENRAYIPLLDQMAAADLAYLVAAGKSAAADARLTNLQADDFQSWFEVNWNTPIEVDEVDKDGKPTGKTRTMTGKQIAAYLRGVDVTTSQQGIAGTGLDVWKRKHPFLMSLTERIVGGVAAGAAMRMGSRSPKGRFVTKSYSNSNGEFVGGSQEDIRMYY